LQKENDLQRLRLQRKNYLIFGAITSLMVFLLIGLLLFRQNKLRANQQKTELEQKQLRAQMNPHFIFNCLNSIQHFVVINDVLNANKYLSGFASLMRQTLENSKEGTITLSKEIAYLENYLALELMRFKDKFTADLVCAENIDINAVKIPAMIIQPFIENAIRHGLNFLDKKQGKLVIKFYLKDGDLFCEIDDNGIGRMQSQKLKEHTNIIYESQGMELTRQRLALVSKSSGSDYSIAIIDKRSVQNEPEGTTVIIKFPVEA
jgi:LytS/YehU family sensor histidine kinase